MKFYKKFILKYKILRIFAYNIQKLTSKKFKTYIVCIVKVSDKSEFKAYFCIKFCKFAICVALQTRNIL